MAMDDPRNQQRPPQQVPNQPVPQIGAPAAPATPHHKDPKNASYLESDRGRAFTDWYNSLHPWVRVTLDNLGFERGAKRSYENELAQGKVEDPRQVALRKKMSGDAEAFRKGLGQYKEEQFQPEQMQANVAEREGLTNVDRSTNRRGLLYSGINELGRADVSSQKALTVSQAKQDINRLAEELARSKDLAAASVGLDGMQDIISQQDKLNQEAAANRAARQAQYQQIGQGLGYGLGAYQGMQKPTTQASGTGLLTQNYDPSLYMGVV